MKLIKKIVITLFVIESFIAYVYYIKVFKIDHTLPAAKVGNVVTTKTPGQKLTTASSRTINPTTKKMQSNSLYKNGIFTGSVADAFYGNIQVQINIVNGKIIKVSFLQYPHDQDTSVQINQEYDPILAQEAIKAQNANVDIVSGATQSSQAFIQSLQQALQNAKS